MGWERGRICPRFSRVKIAVVRETREGETRVAMVPELVAKLTGLGYEVARRAWCRAARAESTTRSTPRRAPTLTDDLLADADVVRVGATR